MGKANFSDDFKHDAVTESFFNLRKRIQSRTYKTRAEARQEVFHRDKMVYNPKRKSPKPNQVALREFGSSDFRSGIRDDFYGIFG